MTDKNITERIQRAEKEFKELLEREKLTFVVREELINGQRVNFGIVFTPIQEAPAIVAPSKEPFMSRNVRRLIHRNN